MSDLVLTSTAVHPSAGITPFRGTAGATIEPGDVCYLDTSANTIKLLDADLSLIASLFKGVAVSGAASGQPVLLVAEDPSFNLGATVAAGTIIICSKVAGKMCPAADAEAGMYITVLGVMETGNKLVLKPVSTRTAIPS